MSNCTWYQFTPATKPRQWRKWMGRIAVHDDGTVFVPAAVSGRGDTEVFLCANFDAVPVAREGNRVWVPAEWVKREFPQSAALVDKILGRISKAPAAK